MNNSEIRIPNPELKGYYFPAEWEKHRATWLSYPHNENSWPGKIETIFPSYHLFIKTLAENEQVHINVLDKAMADRAEASLRTIGTNMQNVVFHQFPTNDAWCRDHGPAFLLNRDNPGLKAIVDWNYNAWGGKYPCDLDNLIPTHVADYLGLPVFKPGMVMEGGSVDFNGCGDVLTTTSCLLNPNRNPNLSQGEIEKYLCNYYGVENVIWLGDGIDGDDTDGHVDDLTRFCDNDTIITAVETNRNDENYAPLRQNLKTLNKIRLASGKQPTVVELPMPDIVVWEGQRLPASYANFYVANGVVVVPAYRCKADDRACQILQDCFPSRTIQPIDSADIIWGLGSFHCLSQQEPATSNQ